MDVVVDDNDDVRVIALGFVLCGPLLLLPLLLGWVLLPPFP